MYTLYSPSWGCGFRHSQNYGTIGKEVGNWLTVYHLQLIARQTDCNILELQYEYFEREDEH